MSRASRRDRRRRAAVRHHARGGPIRWIYDFGLRVPARVRPRDRGRPRTVRGRVREVWCGDAESDGFNRLVLLAGLTAREVAVVRALCRYLRQTGTPFSQDYIEQTLGANPHIARRFAELFAARFDPARVTTPRRPGSSRTWSRPSTRSRRSTRTASCACTCTSCRRCCAPTCTSAMPTAVRCPPSRSSSTPPGFPTSRCRARSSRSSCRRHASRASTCGPGTSRAAASAGPTGVRTSGPRSSA